MVEIEEKTIVDGRYISDDEVERAASVCVIGNDVKEKYFPVGSPIGKQIKLRGVPLTIVGLEEKRGSFFGGSQDRHMYIPITLHNQIFNRTGGIQVHGKSKTK